jgi:hypothetical protein
MERLKDITRKFPFDDDVIRPLATDYSGDE